MQNPTWKTYTLEFLSVFTAVLLAFALSNWSDNRRDNKAEEKILLEISSGLKKDLGDIQLNALGHEAGLNSCRFWRDLIRNKPVVQDSMLRRYIELTRDFTSLQNVAGYETLKSKGLEIVENDSLRSAIISLYEYDYPILRKLEEDYEEMQFQKNYFAEINEILAPYYVFDEEGRLIKMDAPINLPKAQKNKLLSMLAKIEVNRNYILYFYGEVEKKVNDLDAQIQNELD